ncbi:ribosome-inactivating family protein [Spiroplasma endosymbiont of Seladonia tumulorum]|uniref:ribosome-inactivating family protein n=1 Tax=Spiroplasma endosymbiont of Seladonia tumulorum TaxID=3066321 RepID=UPI0030D46AEA
MIPVEIIDGNVTRNIELVIRLSNFYLVGFIVGTGTFQGNTIRNYYYFTENNNMDLTHIENTIAADFSLNYNGNYNTLINTNNFSLSWGNIFDAFIILSKTNTSNRNWNNLWLHLARVIVTTSESIRFRSIFNLISNEIQTYSGELSWNNDISNIVTNWQSRSNNIIDAINNI